MNALFVLFETSTNGYQALILDLLSLAAILSGILVITSKNPVVSVLYLIALFLSVSSILFVLGINFIGLAYLLVYVGAVSILFIFILMLINVRISELHSNTSTSIPLAILASIAFYIPVHQVLPHYNEDGSSFLSKRFNVNLTTISDQELQDFFSKLIDTISINIDSNAASYATAKQWDAYLAETSHITTIGQNMYTSYSIWLIIASLILLLAMVGTIVITIKQKETLVAKPSNKVSGKTLLSGFPNPLNTWEKKNIFSFKKYFFKETSLEVYEPATDANKADLTEKPLQPELPQILLVTKRF